MSLSDWRDGWDHLEAAAAPQVYDRSYLQSNIAGGEGFDWFYARPTDRDSQIRTPITADAYGKPWVHRFKVLRAWWQSPHFNRPGGVESGTPKAWIPQSKPTRFAKHEHQTTQRQHQICYIRKRLAVSCKPLIYN